MTQAPLLQQIDRTYVLHQGRRLTYFGGCDYFRLASHSQVLRAAREGLQRHGLNVAASRFTTGDHELYHALENELSEFFDVEAATLLSNGYLAPLAVAQALAGEFSHVLIDRESHPCLMEAALFFGARVSEFDRGDVGAAKSKLRRMGKKSRVVLITEGMFGHDGELAPLGAYLDILPERGLLMVDDAHGAGTLGKTGKGTHEELGLSAKRLVRTTTLSKAFGAYGGVVLGDDALARKVRAKSSIFVGNTPLPLPLASAALKSIDLLGRDATLRIRLQANIGRVKTALRTVGDARTPIVGIALSDTRRANALRKRLFEHGIFPPFIRYPGGPPNGYFRFAVASEHTEAQLSALIGALT